MADENADAEKPEEPTGEEEEKLEEKAEELEEKQ